MPATTPSSVVTAGGLFTSFRRVARRIVRPRWISWTTNRQPSRPFRISAPSKVACAPPFRQAEFDILYNVGISHESLLVDIGVEEGIIEKSGSWYSYGDLRLGQGKENTREFLIENPDVLEEVDARVRVALGMVDAEEAESESAVEEVEIPAEVPVEVAANGQG